MKKPNRSIQLKIKGPILEFAARVMETPFANQPLSRIAGQQMGLDVLTTIRIPDDVPPFQQMQLGKAPLAKREDDHE